MVQIQIHLGTYMNTPMSRTPNLAVRSQVWSRHSSPSNRPKRGTGPGMHQLRWNFNVPEDESAHEKRTKAASQLGNKRQVKSCRP